ATDGWGGAGGGRGGSVERPCRAGRSRHGGALSSAMATGNNGAANDGGISIDVLGGATVQGTGGAAVSQHGFGAHAGAGKGAFVMVGHGGYKANAIDAAVGGVAGNRGNIDITVGDSAIAAGSYASAVSHFVLQAGTGTNTGAFAQIGHGGLNSTAVGGLDGNP